MAFGGRTSPLLGKHCGASAMWKECKIDLAQPGSTAMGSMRANTNAIKFLASGHWRRWSKSLPLGAGGIGRVCATSIDYMLAKDGDTSLPQYNDIWVHVFINVLVDKCITFDVLCNPKYWRDVKNPTLLGKSPFYSVAARRKTVQYLDFLVANAPWFNSTATEQALDSITGMEKDHDKRPALSVLCKVLRKAFENRDRFAEDGSARAPKRRRLCMDLSDSE
eukprot:362414-Rhodomonas_salina.1